MNSWTPEQVIGRLAECASAIASQSGEPGIEIAGQTLSFLAANPEHIDRFMAEGNELWIDGTINVQHGCLSYRCIDNKIRTSSEVRDLRKLTQ